MKLEIGCGHKKPHRADFIGLDRFPLPGVDVTCDLDRDCLPFPDDYFDLVYASHSLEHLQDLLGVMVEIWRVCKPGGQLCILAPYAATSLNIANPYHLHQFNEHTPRFWTTCPETQIDPAEWQEPFVWQSPWGLANTDNSEPRLDFRCCRMEFFYFPRCHRLRDSERRALRKKEANVCHSILYHLVAVKPPCRTNAHLHGGVEYYIPPEVEDIRRGLDLVCSSSHLNLTMIIRKLKSLKSVLTRRYVFGARR